MSKPSEKAMGVAEEFVGLLKRYMPLIGITNDINFILKEVFARRLDEEYPPTEDDLTIAYMIGRQHEKDAQKGKADKDAESECESLEDKRL